VLILLLGFVLFVRTAFFEWPMDSRGKDPHDWLRRSTPFSRLINPELHAKPNLTVGAIGTGIFIFVIANLAYQKYCYERRQNPVAAKTSPRQSVELVLSDNDQRS
jgi:hypothetical protein